jgi:hypothetical protein
MALCRLLCSHLEVDVHVLVHMLRTQLCACLDGFISGYWSYEQSMRATLPAVLAIS